MLARLNRLSQAADVTGCYDRHLNDPENVIKEAKLFGTKTVGRCESLKFLESLI